MANFPDIEVWVRPSSSRGGGEYSKVRVDAKTQMPCGEEIKTHKRVNRNKEISTKDALRREVKRDGYKHAAQCNKSACKSKRD